MLIVLTVLASLTACGGGGGGADAGTATAATAALPATPTDTTTSLISGATSGSLTGSTGTGSDVAAATATIETPGAPLVSQVPNVQALGASGLLTLEGVPSSATPTAAPGNLTGRNWYLDSSVGSDTNDGAAASAGAAGRGPWRTLARLMTASLTPGDTIVLACNSVWNETLRLPASGTAAQPIVISAPATGCSTPPTIDGSVAIAPSAWTVYKGKIYKAALASPPLQLFVGSGVFTEAHHPNRGFLTSDPSSPYAALAADSSTTTVKGQASSLLTTGGDLALPSGAAITRGTRLRLRTASWLIDEAVVSSVSGAQLSLATPTSYPAQAGTGYLLLGQLWMVDSAGEWYYDDVAKQLYAWMPDSAAPTTTVAASTLTKGIDLDGKSYLVINGLVVRRSGTGVSMRNSIGVAIRNSTIEDSLLAGIDAAASRQATLDANVITRAGTDAVSGQNDSVGEANGMTVRNNVIRDSGVIMLGEQVLSLPRRSFAAIHTGTAGLAIGNTIVNSGYIGIRANSGSSVVNNFVFGACSVLDDGAGIYAWHTQGVTITGNTVVHARGVISGNPANQQFTQAQGIYLDNESANATVQNNTVMDADHGIVLHDSSNNTITGNRLYGNRVSQLRMVEDSRQTNTQGDVFGNTVVDNQIASVATGSVGLLLQTSYTSTAAFGSFDSNRYYDRTNGIVAVASTPAGTQAYTLEQWRRSTGVGSKTSPDVNGKGVDGSGYAAYAISGGNLVANSAFLGNATGWSHWNTTLPYGQFTVSACAIGNCLRYTPGGSAGTIVSPNFSVVKGQWYRLSVDLSVDTAGQSIGLMVRRGGGGSNGYDSVSSRSLTLTSSGTAWTRQVLIFQATSSVTAHDPVTGDNGARVDIEGLVPGKSVSMANLELVPITPDSMARFSGAMTNVGSAAANASCPLASTSPAACGSMFNLADSLPVSWPLSMPAGTTTIVYSQNMALVDSDGDGIPDAVDRCAGSPVRATVNASGCSIDQH